MKKQMYVVRTNYAGVFFGEIKRRDGDEVTMRNVRKLWCWDGACGVEQLAADGVQNPAKCKFTVVVKEMIILGVNQILPCTDKATKSLGDVAIWRR